MTSRPPSPRTVALVLTDGDKSVPSSLEAISARGKLRLERYDSITPSAIATNRVLAAQLRKTKDAGGRLHLLGLLSEGGTSSSLNHLEALIDVSKAAGVRVVVHAFLEGDERSRGSAEALVASLEARLVGGVGRIGTLSGRTFGMAPGGRWDRIEKLYRALMADNVTRIDTALEGLRQGCQFGVPEQFLAPFVVFDYPGVSLVDSALHFNFAADGARELTRALAAPKFEHFTRKGERAPFAGRFACMTPFDDSLGLPSLFPRAPDPAELPLDELGAAGRPVQRYVEGPGDAVARATAEAMTSGKFAFILADLASPSNAERSRGDALDAPLLEITKAARAVGGAVIILGGRDASDCVPFAFVGDASERARVRSNASVSDLAPTVLELMQVPRPSDMPGAPLLEW
jgi:bisphosphoglycerate-independent phosphoglycerate mutase (AlkP superfamily)